MHLLLAAVLTQVMSNYIKGQGRTLQILKIGQWFEMLAIQNGS